MENRLPIELASDYNLYKEAVANFYINIGSRLGKKQGLRKIKTKKRVKDIEEIEAEMTRRQEELEEKSKNNWIGGI